MKNWHIDSDVSEAGPMIYRGNKYIAQCYDIKTAQTIAALPDVYRALVKCRNELQGFLGQCGKEEIKDSFQNLEKAFDTADAALTKMERRK